MGIVAISAKHSIQSFMHFIAHNTFRFMAVETERLPCHSKQLFISGLVWIVTCSTVSSCNRTMQVIVLFAQIFMAGIAKSGLGLKHAPKGLLVVTG